MENKKLIYTSYDGDNIPYINLFIKTVIEQNNIPINPTRSLGYYISTIAHNNSKAECLKDCISLEMICDELWVFLDDSKHLPEGVLLEISMWKKYKKGYIKYLSIENIKKNITFENCILPKVTINDSIDSEIVSITPDINDLRNVCLLKILPQHHKYIDWVKLHIFSKDLVPLDYLSIKELSNFKSEVLYYNELDFISEKVGNVLTIEGYSENYNLTLAECKIPKYINKSNWALTNSERY